VHVVPEISSQTDRQTYSSQYFATVPVGEVMINQALHCCCCCCTAGIQKSLESHDASEPGVVYYELMASVCYVRDKQTGGNLVAHVLAGERYHKRKEGVTHKTWYLFNDFAITPIEKVSLLSDWPVFPCLKCVVPGATDGGFGDS